MLNSIRTAGAVAILLLATPVFAQDGTAPTKEMIIAGMMSEGATEEQATCFLDALGEDWLRLMGSMGPDMAEADMTTIQEAMQSCGVQPPDDGQ